ncbi:MAG: triphosphoribosyl-dephospho-CoA synthase [Planctomycetaceae bacterium]|nr:triphosphoribosyl-dephospho-CoA synthase [Planctomycetaceae bacterium]
MSTLADQIEIACLLEATARKPGNVHPGARFVDLEYADFVRAAAVSAPILARTAELGVGPAILDAVRATRSVCASNVNLGICLLLAPIAAVDDPRTLRQGVGRVLRETTVADAAAVYEAIRLASPGGMGSADAQDVAAAPTVTLLEAMQLAAERDAIAYEWGTGFRGLDRDGVAWLRESWHEAEIVRRLAPRFPDGVPVQPWECAIIATQILLMAQGDTLIRRKCGDETFRESIRLANDALHGGSWETPEGWEKIVALDGWLRADGHRRNPGTTADLMAACLFWGIRKGWIVPPSQREILDHAHAIERACR